MHKIVLFREGFRMAISHQGALILLAASVLGAQVFVSPTSAEDLLEEVRAGNKAAIESIRTLSCRMTVASPISKLGPVTPTTADYWSSMDSWRLRSPGGDAAYPAETVKHNFTIRTMYHRRSEASKVLYIERATPDEMAHRFNVHGRGLLTLCGPAYSALPLEKLLLAEHKIRQITRQRHQGHECIVLRIWVPLTPEQSGEYEIWFDTEVNYLACKLIGDFTRTTRGKSRRESQVLRFTEAAPGIYFPVEADTKFYRDGKVTHHDVVTFSEIRVNEPLPPDIFDLPIPPSSTVVDHIQDRHYKVDANGKVVGEERPVDKLMPLGVASVVPPASPDGSPAVAQLATTTEPQPVTRWIMYGFLALLTVTGGIWYFRRLRAAAAG
ncbi:MAG: hypothetical protein IAF94_06485 [Pirellulaceae bacterium]|nr:hypothetical protein [Pirellulaceae bacterium]